MRIHRSRVNISSIDINCKRNQFSWYATKEDAIEGLKAFETGDSRPNGNVGTVRLPRGQHVVICNKVYSPPILIVPNAALLIDQL